MKIRLVLDLPWRRLPSADAWAGHVPPPSDDPRALEGCWLCADADRNGPSRIEVSTNASGRLTMRACWSDDEIGVTWQHGEAEAIPGGLLWRAEGPIPREGTLFRSGNSLELRLLSTPPDRSTPMVTVHRYSYAINQAPMLPVAAKPVQSAWTAAPASANPATAANPAATLEGDSVESAA